MPASLVVGPAGAGKTAFAVNAARQEFPTAGEGPRVVVASRLQVSDWQRRLAETGGAMGVSVYTFDGLCTAILDVARQTYVLLPDPVRYRLLRSVVDAAPLRYYAPLAGFPGFVSSLQAQIDELEAASIQPQALVDAAASRPQEPRLVELAGVYSGYQQQLSRRGWVGRAGLARLAVKALVRSTAMATDWPLLLVDGFDSFTQVQLDVLAVLACRVKQMTITLTGDETGDERTVFDRFRTTRSRLESVLGASLARVSSLPPPQAHEATTLRHVAANLGGTTRTRENNDGAISLVACPDRVTEVREALRWLKARILLDGFQLRRCALLARSLSPYRPFVAQIAAEFGLPVRLAGGEPLNANPLVAAILDLLRLTLPSGDDGQPALPRRASIAAWHCPYFDWEEVVSPPDNRALGLTAEDADALGGVARTGQVLGGLEQWREGFLVFQTPRTGEDEQEAGEERLRAAQTLWAKFDGFLRLLTPPATAGTFRDFVSWLEDLIGPDATSTTVEDADGAPANSLQIVKQARAAGQDPQSVGLVERDLAALSRFKDVLRGLVWAEEVVPTPEVLTYEEFVKELSGAVSVATYPLPLAPTDRAVLVAGVHQARGLPFDAVAILGLAEGEFPASPGEDMLLDDVDREWLGSTLGLPIDLSTESAETECFYEAITRADRRLLLTRPRLTDTGADWPPSPFWEEVADLVRLEPLSLSTDSRPPPDAVASWTELLENAADASPDSASTAWVAAADPVRWRALQRANAVVAARAHDGQTSPFDGDLACLAPRLRQRFGPSRLWSATQLEAYHTCPFSFFTSRVLCLEPRIEPAEGIDAGTLGGIYHRILKQLFSSTGEPADAAIVLEALPAVAADVLDRAPQEDGFRCTAWWQHTRQEIEANIRDTLPALFEETTGFVPIVTEAGFGEEKSLQLLRENDAVSLRGTIDRVDRNASGELLVIDYKTSGPTTYTFASLYEGRHLQLPFYALAARDVLGLGRPVDGFFWHIHQAKPSPLRLARHEQGIAGCVQVAIDRVWQAVDAIREGRFRPRVPADGCPGYCPAASICWHFRPGFGG